jgi:hypothetical protein
MMEAIFLGLRSEMRGFEQINAGDALVCLSSHD